MASRKDFGQKRRTGTSASPKKPAAKKSSPRAAPPPPRPRPWGLMLASVAAVVALGFGLSKLLSVSPTDSQSAERVSKPAPVAKPAPAKPAPKPTPVAKKPEPKAEKKPAAKPQATVTERSTQAEQKEPYSFYEILPNSQVETQPVDAYKSTPKTTALEQRKLLQTGSFRNRSDAENMRAQLLLMNLPNVHISKSDGSNGTWYRVRVGPFTDRSKLNKAQDKLAAKRISTLEMNVR